jgi:hypothetical protein
VAILLIYGMVCVLLAAHLAIVDGEVGDEE